jgi:hypothetical protein
VGGGVQEALQLRILRDLERGLQVDEEALAREVPQVDPRDVSRAVQLLRERGDVEPSSGESNHHLSLTAWGRQRLSGSSASGSES